MNIDMTPFEERIDDLVDRLLPRVEREVPLSGDFAPVYEEFYVTDEPIKSIARKFQLKVHKLPEIDVPDPELRFIEAAIFTYGGYKADSFVGGGKKDIIVNLLKAPGFKEHLYDSYATLLELLMEG